MRTRRRSRGIVVVLIIVMVTITGAAVLLTMRLLPVTQTAAPSMAVLVAAHDLSMSQSLGPADVATAVVPASASLGQTIPAASISSVVGERVRVPLYAGQLLDNRALYAGTPAPPSALDLLGPGDAVVTIHALALSTPLTGLPSDSVVAIYATTSRAPLTTTVQSPADAQTLQTSQDEVTLINPAARVVDYEPTQGAISVIVPRTQASTLYLLEDTAVLHFALVRPDDHPTKTNDTMDTRRYSQEYHVPTH